MILGLEGSELIAAFVLGAVVAASSLIAHRRRPDRLLVAVRFGAIWAAVNLTGAALRRSLGPTFESIMAPIAGVATIALVLAVFWIETKPMRQEPGPRGES